MDYQARQELEKIKRYTFKDVINLKEAASICLLSEERLLELAQSGFAPCIIVDRDNYHFNRIAIYKWAKENLIEVRPGQNIPREIRLLDHNIADPIGVPDTLVSIFPNLKEIRNDGFGPCVYFLIKDQKVIYIGQSTSLANRIDTHRNTKKFDRVFYLPCPRESLGDVESAFIRSIRPPLNLAQINSKLTETNESHLAKIGYSSPGKMREA